MLRNQNPDLKLAPMESRLAKARQVLCRRDDSPSECHGGSTLPEQASIRQDSHDKKNAHSRLMEDF